MYSAFAGIVRRTERASPFERDVEDAETMAVSSGLTRINPVYPFSFSPLRLCPAPTGTKRPSAGAARPVRLVSELHPHREPLSVAQKREPHDLSGQQSLADHAD